MKKAVIRERVSGVRLRDTVPPLYREEIAKGTDPNGIYTVILCPHTERDVVSSPTLTKAFRQLRQAAPDGIIIVGTVFTVEAQAFAEEHQARILSLHKSNWTDESARQRQLE